MNGGYPLEQYVSQKIQLAETFICFRTLKPHQLKKKGKEKKKHPNVSYLVEQKPEGEEEVDRSKHG